ncbi:hypothetical protein, conserved in T. vivax [Trypanosoma vivax Y486]|uniref:Uncharacterized protein n=1 Tax=Trypanosoma vivax (strain Y486) TaxID=1055687 RepID=F9WLA4_TRYVY|nr:hypothetical protein, conserved in T. vivax [Trypanosoma vivax Y486]|eukprot:CCD18292.1 hypothetical protein, conserved in T. vivax [Trypanosoma vivax Y486]
MKVTVGWFLLLMSLATACFRAHAAFTNGELTGAMAKQICTLSSHLARLEVNMTIAAEVETTLSQAARHAQRIVGRAEEAIAAMKSRNISSDSLEKGAHLINAAATDAAALGTMNGRQQMEATRAATDALSSAHAAEAMMDTLIGSMLTLDVLFDKAASGTTASNQHCIGKQTTYTTCTGLQADENVQLNGVTLATTLDQAISAVKQLKVDEGSVGAGQHGTNTGCSVTGVNAFTLAAGATHCACAPMTWAAKDNTGGGSWTTLQKQTSLTGITGQEKKKMNFCETLGKDIASVEKYFSPEKQSTQLKEDAERAAAKICNEHPNTCTKLNTTVQGAVLKIKATLEEAAETHRNEAEQDLQGDSPAATGTQNSNNTAVPQTQGKQKATQAQRDGEKRHGDTSRTHSTLAAWPVLALLLVPARARTQHYAT